MPTDDVTGALAALTITAENKQATAYLEFDYVQADFSRRQSALRLLNPLDPECNKTAAARWKDFHVGTNLTGIHSTESWFGA